MAGTDASCRAHCGGPTIVLVQPQLGENIGAAARAMWNCGLTELRLVRPRDPWPNPRAYAAASGADEVLHRATVFDRTADAVGDLGALYATTARLRDMVKPVFTPRSAAALMRLESPSGEGCGVLFGPERTGLANDDVALARAAITVPLNPASSSLNLAHAVLLIGYEWLLAADLAPPQVGRRDRGSRAATGEEVGNLMAHLAERLEAAGFFLLPAKRPIMERNLRNIFTRAGLTEQEVRTLHGVFTALAGRPRSSRRAD